MLTTAYARREIATIVVVGGLLTALAGYFLHYWALVPGILTLGLLAFFRDPPRKPIVGDNLILAPADGRIVEIARDAAGPAGPGRLLRITVFLGVHDVHVNRSPCAGRVTAIQHRGGEFLNALRAEASARNVSCAMTLDPDAPLPGPIRVRQISGILARRIVCAAAVGERLSAGQRYGMIKLGSRTEVSLPEDPRWQLEVKPGQCVKAGLSIIARLAEKPVTASVASAPPPPTGHST